MTQIEFIIGKSPWWDFLGLLEVDKQQDNRAPIDVTSFSVPIKHFYGWVIGAVLLVLGGAWAMHQDLKSDLSSLKNQFANVQTENAKMSGQLTLILPFVERQLFNRVETDPASLGLYPISPKNFVDIPVGWSIMETTKLRQLAGEDGSKFDFGEAKLDTPFSVVACDPGGDSKACTIMWDWDALEDPKFAFDRLYESKDSNK